jgi:hypothetical protein
VDRRFRDDDAVVRVVVDRGRVVSGDLRARVVAVLSDHVDPHFADELLDAILAAVGVTHVCVQRDDLALVCRHVGWRSGMGPTIDRLRAVLEADHNNERGQ